MGKVNILSENSLQEKIWVDANVSDGMLILNYIFLFFTIIHILSN